MTKPCWQCAEQIQEAAIVCRYCGADQITKKAKKPEDKSSGGGGIGCIGTGLAIVVAFIVFGSLLPDTPEQKARETAQSAPPANDPAKCEKIIGSAQRAGLVLARPSAERINVDERLWAATAASEKSVIMQMLLCVRYGGRTMEQVDTMDYVVAYGQHSGKRLAILGSTGLTVE